MSKVIDISAQMTNAKPTLKISEDMVYPVNDRKSTMILLNQKMKSADLNDLDEIDGILTVLLGKKAVKEIDKLDPSFSAYQKILVACMAAVTGEDYETADARFQEAATEVES